MTFIQPKQISADHRTSMPRGDALRTKRCRSGLLVFSGILGLYALWQLTAFFLHPAVPYFLSEASPVEAGKAPAAAMAAQVARIRGDFWFDDALLTWAGASRSGTEPSQALGDARAAAVRSARLAPHDARAWLLLALLESELGQEPHRQAEALKLSYYTGPSDSALMPSRLQLAVRSAAIADPDFQTLVQSDVLSAVRQATLQAALVASYRQASQDGKRFLETAVGALDSGLLAKMQAGASDPIRY